jgi:NAD+ diphosphatase
MKKIYPYFSQNPLDRLDSTRRNPKEVEKLKASSNTKFILFDNDKVLFDKQTKNCFFSNIELDTTDAILLGRENDINYFVLYN